VARRWYRVCWTGGKSIGRCTSHWWAAEPLIRHRELSRILPELSRRRVFTLVVTSAVIAILRSGWGLAAQPGGRLGGWTPEHHDERRRPATYTRILEKHSRSRG